MTDFVKNAKLTELENKIPDESNIVTKAALTAVENKIPSVSSLAKKQTITRTLLKLKRNLLTIIMINILQLQSLILLAEEIFIARLAQPNLTTKTDFDATLPSLNRKFTKYKTKHLLVENELKKLKTFDSSYFIGKSHFKEVHKFT